MAETEDQPAELAELDFAKGGGLLPAVVQDAQSGEVLMLGYMNAEALRRTLATGRTCFWSRSRGCFWVKGETSGNIQEVVEVRADCDGDALLVRARQRGVACHTGRRSCFFRPLAPPPGAAAGPGGCQRHPAGL